MKLDGDTAFRSISMRLIGMACLVGLLCQGVSAQGVLGGTEPPGTYPHQSYYLALDIYRSGDLKSATDMFERVPTRRDINGRWIDSIPVLAMRAECYWQLGNVVAARQAVDEVFQIAIRNRGWLSKVGWDQTLQAGVVPQDAGLWPEAAAIQRVSVSDKIMYGAGKLVNANDIRRGGAIEEPTLRPMDIVELMRGLAIAAYRRRVILGQLSIQDPLAVGLLDATKYPAGANLPIVRSLVGSMRSSVRFALHDDQQAVAEAQQSVTFNGGVHPITAIAMVTNCSALAGSKNPATAVPLAISATNSAAALRQPEWMGEAMQIAAGCATTPEQADLVRQAATKVAAGIHRRSRFAALHCLVAGADAAVSAGNIEAAIVLLEQARTLAARRDVMMPRVETYASYVAARIAAAKGNSVGINAPTELDAAISQIQNFAFNNRSRSRQVFVSMPRIYQIELVRAATGTSLGGKSSDDLLKIYVNDPAPDVWRRDAVNALASVMADREKLALLRLQLAASQSDGEAVLKRANDLFAARFRQRLPLGGRIAQVRHLARSEEMLLSKEAVEFRKTAPPQFKELRGAANAAAQPNAITSQKLEAGACAVALSKHHLPLSMPPQLDEKLPLTKLPPRTAMLMFVEVGNRVHATFSVDGRTSTWKVPSTKRLAGEINALLSSYGVGKPRGNRLPENDSWRKAAVTLRRKLLPDDATVTSDRIDELIVVPDGALWYLPFEVLPVGGEESDLICDVMRVRYAPTPGFAFYPTAMPPQSRAIGVATEAFFAPRDPDQNEVIAQSIVDVIAEPVRLPESSDTPTGLLGDSVGHLVVGGVRTPNMKSLLATSVAGYDQNNPAGTIAGWTRFPATVPRTVVLPGFRTPVDVSQTGTGQELFVTLCGLHSAGVRDVMLSRWPVGGESTALAMRELVQELPFGGLFKSWQRARMILRSANLDPIAEPLLTKADQAVPDLSGNEPLFWSGYLISSPLTPPAPE